MFGPHFHLPAGVVARRIIGHDDFAIEGGELLGGERPKAAVEQRRPQVGWHDNRREHRQWSPRPGAFSRRNDPITRASSGEVQNDSTASRGVQTMGSPRVLNEVLTRIGTPVRAWNAFSRS